MCKSCLFSRILTLLEIQDFRIKLCRDDEEDHLFSMDFDGSSTGLCPCCTAGSNTGASMVVGPVSNNCNCINIYVNNNVQGMTNSVVLGSQVVMRDPGVRITLQLRQPESIEESMESLGAEVASLARMTYCFFLFASLSFILLCMLFLWKYSRF
ncbi:hypothetical protein IHE45_02G079800 [Dioscorea alata]|uniref:Uncharacterized protein n=1 Tax=Dioscorea alata TaxID=55571 RepID=A0ACB7WRS4_DIOAL|nr:hypothetical protein IHE45_02G079800 [Dioscorea alata]